MQITPWEIYLLTRLDELHDTCGIIAWALLLGTVVFGMLYARAVNDEDDDAAGKARKIALRLFTLVLAFGFGGCFIPTTKEAVAAIIVPKLAANEQIQKLPANLLSLANDWIEELKPKKDSK